MYQKPKIFKTDDLTEGVYAASGSGCYTTTAYIHQTPQTGRGDYRIQVDAQHHADHTRGKQRLTITFNQPVKYKECHATGATLVSDGSVLVLDLSYPGNPTENIGFGDLVVFSEAGLAITGCQMTD